MKVLGVEIRHPSTRELALAVALFVVIAGVVSLWAHFEGRPLRDYFPLIFAYFSGVMGSAFGLSVMGGWRHLTLFAGLGIVAFTVMLGLQAVI